MTLDRDPQHDPLLGYVIDDRYRIERQLGAGGMGIVYKAVHVKLGKPLAVKVLRPELSTHSEALQRFEQEALSASQIGHSHIVDIVDFGTLPSGSAFLVMEYLSGRSLGAVLAACGRLDAKRTLHVARQLASALEAAHARSIVHRDLKPDNLQLIERDGDPDFVKVLDFGIAKVIGSANKLTMTGQELGTPCYMAPEQWEGGERVDARTDIYAVGVILYEMCCGRPPFEADSQLGLFVKHMSESPLPLQQRAPEADVPPALEAIILKCLQKEPEARYASMTALRAALTLAMQSFAAPHTAERPSATMLYGVASPRSESTSSLSPISVMVSNTWASWASWRLRMRELVQSLVPRFVQQLQQWWQRGQRGGGLNVSLVGLLLGLAMWLFMARSPAPETNAAVLGSNPAGMTSKASKRDEPTTKPNWATDFGRDAFGVYADVTLNGVVQRMRWIPAGQFVMGSPQTEAERAEDEMAHETALNRGFWLADTECTQRLWRAVMGDNPSYFRGDELPVERVSWDAIQRFLKKAEELSPGLGLQLPTEAQWEYACRAGTQTPFGLGEMLTSQQANFDGKYPYAGASKDEFRGKTLSVRSLPSNAWGLYHMHGNVWEWCSDRYGAYEAGPVNDPAGAAAGEERVLRGGSWYTHASSTRCARRYHYVASFRNQSLGFRVSRSQSE